MATTVDQLLEHRARRQARAQRSSFLYSFLSHGTVVGAMWLLPQLFVEPPEKYHYIAVTVVPPQILGAQEPPPPPPPPPKIEPPPPKVEPPPPEPPPEPVPEDVPVIVEKKKKVEKKPPPPPPKKATPPPPKVEPPPKRVGSPFGNPLGATTNQATVGVEDPNFTYGYYLDRVVAVISANWVRPQIGNLEAKLHFRIKRDGTITELRLVESSTSREFDDAAARAVSSSSPLPPLPKGYTRDDLGINLIVK
ncbi:MAG: TonB C-terminal domain-containing protein [bacterium]|nr:TonB C-terminal domain-containing protein [bacterium]